MGQSFGGDNSDDNSTRKAVTRGVLNATAGGLNAASGAQPQQPPVDFSGIGKAIKKVRSPKVFTMNNPTTGVIPQNPPLPSPDINLPITSPMNPNPMPDLYSGPNAQIPQLRKPINGMLPFYGQ